MSKAIALQPCRVRRHPGRDCRDPEAMDGIPEQTQVLGRDGVFTPSLTFGFFRSWLKRFERGNMPRPT
ncbi:MAG: hypothetical protein WAW41_03525 [Methylobacter sp.]